MVGIVTFAFGKPKEEVITPRSGKGRMSQTVNVNLLVILRNWHIRPHALEMRLPFRGLDGIHWSREMINFQHLFTNKDSVSEM